MAVKGYTNISNSGLVLHIDAYNKKSYVDGNTVTNDLGPNDFGKYTLSFVEQQPYVSDYYDNGNLMFITSNRTNPRQSIYKIDDDLSYKFSSDALYVGGASFDTTEIVNGLPVMYGGGFPGNITLTPFFARYEYQGNDTWSRTFTKSLSNRRHCKINIDKYNTTNGRSDLWLSSSSNSSSTQYLTLHQWNGSDYTEYDFTSKVTSFVPFNGKFVVSAVPVSNGRLFLICHSYTTIGVTQNACIVDLTYTGGTYTDSTNWTTTLIAGGTSSTDFGDTDGVLGVNKLMFLTNYPPTIYKGSVKNGQPCLYFSSFWPTSWGNSITESYIRELFWNGSAWEVTTHVTQTTNIQFAGSINQNEDRFYARNATTQEIGYYELSTGNFVAFADALTENAGGGTEQERVPKTIDIINGVTFDTNSWSFDGVNDYIEIPSVDGITNFTHNDDYSIGFWAYIDSSKAGNFVFLEKWTTIPEPYPYVFRYLRSPDRLAIQAYNGSTGQGTLGPIEADKWVYIMGVFDWSNNLLTSYVDGEFHDSATINITGIGNSIPAYLGRRGNDTFYYKGNISNLTIYNKALSAPEVKQNYNATKWRFQ